MKKWEDKGSGQWKLSIVSDDPTDGTPVQVYHGTREAITEQLADAQGQATKRIAELKRGTPPAPNQPGPQALTAADRMQVVADLANPAKVDGAVTRILESVTGPVANLREAAQHAPQEREERQTREAVSAAERFAAETPEWFPSDFNKNALVGYMRTQGMSPSNRGHYTQAFEAMTAAGLLQARPEEDDETQPPAQEAERIAPTPARPKAPTRISTGVTARDVSGTQPKPSNRLKFTREQIDNMSRETYKANMRDPEFQRAVEFYAKQPRRRAS